MALYSILILALVQGITEFLPISSSGHLVLVHAALNEGLEPQAWANALLMDVAVHVGTLFSVIVYFRHDFLNMVHGARDMVTGNVSSDGAKLNLHILVSSLPVVLVGFIIHQMELPWLRSVEIVAWMTLIFGVVLWVADRFTPVNRSLEDITYKDAFLIGIAQSLALVPGTSRSGITMTAARALGYNRTEAAYYSLLLAIVAIAGAGTLAVKDLIDAGNVSLTLDALIAAVIAFGSGWVAIALMMKWLEKFSFTPFAIYRVLLGSVLLYAIYSGWLA